MDVTILHPRLQLDEVAKTSAQAYHTAQPFPHIAIDDFFNPQRLEQLLAVFPGPNDIEWHQFRSATEQKLGSTHEAQLPLPIRQFLYQLNSSTFLRFLEQLTGIPNLIPDPHFVGGGMHQSVRGGQLAIHADFNKHPQWGLDRRLNLLVYLNKDWQDAWGGQLELWDRTMTTCQQKIAPRFNRMAIFSTTSTSYHGHPHPLASPEGVTRKSLALYYYSNGRPAQEHTARHSTLYRVLPTDGFIRRYVSPWVPPIAYALIDKARHAWTPKTPR
ncbi:MAG: 2OG-Fe(II) oxygenase [Candidatus Omnitrophica bacterium]|nr:2OG-Fe(II) oxygenase [Candidatus Omnitrophota bacterium]